MKKADLHVHSKYSGTSSSFFLQKTQINESYTDPETIYQLAKDKGMDYVTITDHNSIDGVKKLIHKHPEDTFMGVELSVFFPEDQTEVHVLVYDFTESQFEVLNQKRFNIYELREYIFQENLPHAVAHATYSVNHKLTLEHLEKLILLFDSFETINGCRSSASNKILQQTLRSLDSIKMEALAISHKIPMHHPINCIKGFTGGSDDHSGLWIGHTYTCCPAYHLGSFLAALRNKESMAMGKNGNYRYMTANFLKITHHCIQNKQPRYSHKLSGKITDTFFNAQTLSLWSKFKLMSLYWLSLLKRKEFIPSIIKAIYHLLGKRTSMEERINGLYAAVSKLIDDMVLQAISSLSDDFRSGRLRSLISKSMLLFEALLAVSPFIVTLKEQNQQKKIISQLQDHKLFRQQAIEKRILWFTDTFSDLNGVSATLSDIYSISQRDRLPVKFVVSEEAQNKTYNEEKNLIKLQSIYEAPLPFYEQYHLKFPSLLSALQKISEDDPSHIYISTIGPMGLLGLLMANLLHVPVTGIYHTDHTAQVKSLTDQSFIHQCMKAYEQWFFNQMDKVIVHSMAYSNELNAMGISSDKIKWCPKGIDTQTFHFNPQKEKDSKVLAMLYTGRISSDKNIEFLLQVFLQLRHKNPNFELWMAGDGPLMHQLDKSFLSDSSIRWFGRLERSKLVELYQKADLFVFPSNSDTFGMSVLEAQLCGLPAIVSNKGGPKEIILDQQTGFVCSTENMDSWINTIHFLLKEKNTFPDQWAFRKQLSRDHVIQNRDWKYVLPKILDLEEIEILNHTPPYPQIALTV